MNQPHHIDKDLLLKDCVDECKKWRRTLHQHPQTCYEEEFANSFICDRLKEFGVDFDSGMAITGVVGRLTGSKGNGSKKIALRADIDALNILEENTFDYKSKYTGKMHACGHDGHTAMVLACAKYLSRTKDFNGEVYFIFQPAEEGGAGADRMISEGLFDKFPANSVWGMHNTPGLDVGDFAVISGAMMASADEFEIEVIGKGGHAAMPNVSIDPIVVASHIITAAQTIVSRNLSPTTPGVITFSKINAGSAFNIIPERVKICGTFRALSKNARDLLITRLQDLAAGVAKSFGASIKFKTIPNNYPVLINSALETKIAEKVAKKIGNNLHTNISPSLGGEDFAFMLQKKPGCYVFLGNGLHEQRGGNNLHTAKYDFNDDAAIFGIKYWIELVESELN